MDLLRRLGLALCAAIFSLSIFFFALFVSTYYVFDSPKATETALQQSGIYNVAAEDLLQQTQDNADALPLSDPGVKAAVQAALPPATVRGFTEQILNGTYVWVHGQTANPNFSIDLSSTKTAVANNLAAYVQQKVSALPVCTSETELPASANDVLALTCRSPELPVSALVSQVRQQALGNGIFKDSTITAGDLKNAQGVPLVSKLNYIPKLHHYYIWSLFVLPVVGILSALGVLFAARTKRAGLRRLSFTLITTGIYSVAIALVSVWGLNHLAGSVSGQGTGIAALQGSFVKVADILATDLRRWWLGFGIGYVVLGIIGMIVVQATKPRVGVVPKDNPLQHNMDIPAAGTTFGPKKDESKSPASESSPTAAQADTADSTITKQDSPKQ